MAGCITLTEISFLLCDKGVAVEPKLIYSSKLSQIKADNIGAWVIDRQAESTGILQASLLRHCPAFLRIPAPQDFHLASRFLPPFPVGGAFSGCQLPGETPSAENGDK